MPIRIGDMSSKQKPKILRKKSNECYECHFPPITKTSKYFDNQYFNSVKCLTDKCISFVYNLVNLENGEGCKNEGTSSNSKWKRKRTTYLSYLLKLLKLWWCATNGTSQKT